MAHHSSSPRPWYHLALLILGGEAVFILPFVLPRIFRATVLETFALTNTQLGLCFSVYGTVAMISYLLGGPLADRYSPRVLMSAGLLSTALGGVYAVSYPSFEGMLLLYGYWGVTTILLFWAALIKATRAWGGNEEQGRAFSFLDAGRGAVAASFGLLGVGVMLLITTGEMDLLPLSEQRVAFAQMIKIFSALVALVAILIFCFLKLDVQEASTTMHRFDRGAILALVKRPSIYLLSLIVLTAYSGYKVQDVFSLYASNVMGYTDMAAASFGTYLLYFRPVVGVVLGFLPSRNKPLRYLKASFLLMLVGSIWMASGLGHGIAIVFMLSIVTVSIGIYATRCLYFAVMQDANIPLAWTGTAVGLISVLGYTPDIFMGPIMGYFLDTFDGRLGFVYIFALIALLSGIGLLSTLFIRLRQS